MTRQIKLDDQARLTKLEESTTYQNKTIEELSHMLAKQWETIDRLERQVASLVQRFLALEEATAPAPENTKPPHY